MCIHVRMCVSVVYVYESVYESYVFSLASEELGNKSNYVIHNFGKALVYSQVGEIHT